jgi:charged multivesicular body protein 4
LWISGHNTDTPNRDKLRDQNELSNEVMNAIVSNPLGPEIDEDELEAELEQLQQEKLDEQILSTGNVPVADAVHRMPTAAGRERESCDLMVGREAVC